MLAQRRRFVVRRKLVKKFDIRRESRAREDAFKEIGNGTIDIPAVLKAADAAGAKHYFVEQDQSPDPVASLKQSYSYLSKLF